MARRPKRKQRQAVKDQKETRKFFTIVGVSTMVLLLILYLVFRSM